MKPRIASRRAVEAVGVREPSPSSELRVKVARAAIATAATAVAVVVAGAVVAAEAVGGQTNNAVRKSNFLTKAG